MLVAIAAVAPNACVRVNLSSPRSSKSCTLRVPTVRFAVEPLSV
jgi:hypothetical protein